MQTFLPVPDYHAAVTLIDRQRLGRQRLECAQLLRALRGETKGWGNHPAAKMWRGHEHALCVYALAVCDEWIRRGYKDTQRPLFAAALQALPDTGPPAWLGSPEFHAAHRSNLLRKLPAHYQQFGWSEPDSLEYVWPVP